MHSGAAPSTPTDISGSLSESRLRSPPEGGRPIASSSSASHLQSPRGGGTSQEVIVGGGEDHTAQHTIRPTSYHSGGEGGAIASSSSSSNRSSSSQRLSSTGGHSPSQPATPRLPSSLSEKEQLSGPHQRDPLQSLSSKSSPLSSVERRRQGVGVQPRDGMTTEKRSVSLPCVSLEALKLWLDQGRPHKAVWVSSLPCAERLLSRGLGLQAELGKVLHEIEEEARKEKNLQEQEDKEKETRKQGGSDLFDERSKKRKEGDAIAAEGRGESHVEQEGEGGGNSFKENLSKEGAVDQGQQEQHDQISIADRSRNKDGVIYEETRKDREGELRGNTSGVYRMNEGESHHGSKGPTPIVGDEGVLPSPEDSHAPLPSSDRIVAQSPPEGSEQDSCSVVDAKEGRDQEKEGGEQERGESSADARQLEKSVNSFMGQTGVERRPDRVDTSPDRRMGRQTNRPSAPVESEGQEGDEEFQTSSSSREKQDGGDSDINASDEEEKKLWQRLFDAILQREDRRLRVAISSGCDDSSSSGGGSSKGADTDSLSQSCGKSAPSSSTTTSVDTKLPSLSIYAGPHGEEGTCLLQTRNIDWLKLEQRLFQVGVCGLEGDDFFHHLVACSAWFREASLLVECIRYHGRRAYSLVPEKTREQTNDQNQMVSTTQTSGGYRSPPDRTLLQRSNQSSSSLSPHSREEVTTMSSPQSTIKSGGLDVGNPVEKPSQNSPSRGSQEAISSRREDLQQTSSQGADGCSKGEEGEGTEETKNKKEAGESSSSSSSMRTSQVPSPLAKNSSSIPWLQRSVYHIWRMIQVYAPLRQKCLQQYHQHFSAISPMKEQAASSARAPSVSPAEQEKREDSQRFSGSREEARESAMGSDITSHLQRSPDEKDVTGRNGVDDLSFSSSCSVSSHSAVSPGNLDRRETGTGGSGAASAEDSVGCNDTGGRTEGRDETLEREEKQVEKRESDVVLSDCEGVYGSVRVFAEEGAYLQELLKRTLYRIMAFERKLRDLLVLHPLPPVILPGGEDFFTSYASDQMRNRSRNHAPSSHGSFPAGGGDHPAENSGTPSRGNVDGVGTSLPEEEDLGAQGRNLGTSSSRRSSTSGMSSSLSPVNGGGGRGGGDRRFRKPNSKERWKSDEGQSRRSGR